MNRINQNEMDDCADGYVLFCFVFFFVYFDSTFFLCYLGAENLLKEELTCSKFCSKLLFSNNISSPSSPLQNYSKKNFTTDFKVTSKLMLGVVI